MKKLKLTLITISFIVAAQAHQYPFEKNTTQNLAKQRLVSKEPYKLKQNSGNISVPTLTKELDWNSIPPQWNEIRAVKSTYSNNKLISELELSYNLSDTFEITIFNYDVNGRYSSVENREYNLITHDFVNKNKTTYTYFTNGSYSYTVEYYDETLQIWNPSFRNTTIYDNIGNEISYSHETYQNNTWIIGDKYSHRITYYNNTNKISESIDSNFNHFTLMMEAMHKTNSIYNNIGQVTSITNYNYNNGIPEIADFDSVSYDTMGQPVTITFYDGLTMVRTSKIDEINWDGTFNPNIDLSENQPIAYHKYRYINNNWVIHFRFSAELPDNYGSRINLYEVYVNNVYIPHGRSSRINDSLINLIEDSYEFYDSITKIWEIGHGQKNEYQYDINNNMLEAIIKYYSFNDSAYVNAQKLEFSDFINIVAGVNSTKTIETKVYPNPTTNGSVSINLNLENASTITIDLIDLNGKILSTQKQHYGQGLNTIQLDGLTQGLYFVVISSDYGVSRTKLIVK